MYPIELEGLLLAMKRLEQLAKAENWRDDRWRQELAAAAEGLREAGKKLAQASENIFTWSAFFTVGQGAEKAASLYLEALDTWKRDTVSFPGKVIEAQLYCGTVCQLAQAAVLKNELESLCLNYAQN